MLLSVARWPPWLDFPVRIAVVSLGVRLVLAVAIAFALGAGTRAALLPLARRALARPHWTEQARALWPLRSLLLVSLYAIGLSVATHAFLLYSPVAALSVPVAIALTFSAIAVPLWSLRTGFEIATGCVPPSVRSFRETAGVSLIFFPVFWLFMLLSVVPVASASAFWISISGSAVYLLLSGFGAWVVVARVTGLLYPAPDHVRIAVERAASALRRQPPPAYELLWSRPNAAAVPSLGCVFFSSRAAESLTPIELEAIAAHELAHLDEPRWVRSLRQFSSLVVSMPFVVGILASKRYDNMMYFVAGATVSVLLRSFYRGLQQKLEERADAGGREVGGDSYAAALERLHRMQLVPAVLRWSTHPSLYDRMTAAGARPDYPRPRPAVMWPVFLASLLVPIAFVVCVAAFAAGDRLVSAARFDGDWSQYVVASLRGGQRGEWIVVRRLQAEHRLGDAIAFLKSAEAFEQDDHRLLRIARLERDDGDCPSALATLQQLKDRDDRVFAIKRITRDCGQSVTDDDDDVGPSIVDHAATPASSR